MFPFAIVILGDDLFVLWLEQETKPHPDPAESQEEPARVQRLDLLLAPWVRSPGSPVCPIRRGSAPAPSLPRSVGARGLGEGVTVVAAGGEGGIKGSIQAPPCPASASTSWTTNSACARLLPGLIYIKCGHIIQTISALFCLCR